MLGLNLDPITVATIQYIAPYVFGILAFLAVLFLWLSMSPSSRAPSERLKDYGNPAALPEKSENFDEPFVKRVVIPAFRSMLRFFSRFAPKQGLEESESLLRAAGSPMNLTGLDFTGLRLLIAAVAGVGYFILFGSSQDTSILLRNGLMLVALGYLMPIFVLRGKANGRRHDIARALPDALDMLTIGVEAGLSFEAALIRVCGQWDNALTVELRRSLADMQYGVSREDALVSMAERVDVPDLSAFVAVLVQSNQLGVSIADVLRSQSGQMRIKRRQRSEELARQASVKMVFPLVLFELPSLFVVILGPAIPPILEALQGMSG